MIYPEIGKLAGEILDRGKHIILCTNGMFIRKHLHDFRPTSSFFWNVHLDGMERTHDLCVERDGVFREAIEGIKAAKAAGFLVCSNTTIYKETDLDEIAELYDYLDALGARLWHCSTNSTSWCPRFISIFCEVSASWTAPLGVRQPLIRADGRGPAI